MLPPVVPSDTISIKEMIESDQTLDWGLDFMKVPDTWTVTEGEDVNIYVLDTGVPLHVDLKENIKLTERPNFIRNEPNFDINQHSTHVCGILGAVNNTIGIAGVAPKANIYPIKCLNKYGNASITVLVEVLKYLATVSPKPDVVCLSLGMPMYIRMLHKEVINLYNKNIPLVCASGNSGFKNDTVDYPAKFPETIAVAAFDSNGDIAKFSGKGKEVDFAAPGVDIYSTFKVSEYCRMSGTSMATPFMVGLIALMLAKHKKQEKLTGKNDCTTVKNIVEHLIKYTKDKGIIKNNEFGYGIIDPLQLVGDE